MKRSARVKLTLVAGVALAACNRRPLDPCANATFNEQACQDAVNNGGYYWHGTWFPVTYSHPYPYYFDGYRSYRANGGTTQAAPGITYGRPSGSTVRGGFGSTGEGHGSGSGGHGSGAGE